MSQSYPYAECLTCEYCVPFSDSCFYSVFHDREPFLTVQDNNIVCNDFLLANIIE